MLPLLSIGYSVKTRRQSPWIPSFGQSIKVIAPILPLAEPPMPLAIARQRRRFNRRGVWSISRRPTIRGRPVRPQGAVTACRQLGAPGRSRGALLGLTSGVNAGATTPIVPASAPVICDLRVPVFTHRHSPVSVLRRRGCPARALNSTEPARLEPRPAQSNHPHDP